MQVYLSLSTYTGLFLFNVSGYFTHRHKLRMFLHERFRDCEKCNGNCFPHLLTESLNCKWWSTSPRPDTAQSKNYRTFAANRTYFQDDQTYRFSGSCPGAPVSCLYQKHSLQATEIIRDATGNSGDGLQKIVFPFREKIFCFFIVFQTRIYVPCFISNYTQLADCYMKLSTWAAQHRVWHTKIMIALLTVKFWKPATKCS